MSRSILFALCLLASAPVLPAPAVASGPLSISDALKRSTIGGLHISPDGKHIAAIVYKGEGSRAVIFDTETLTPRLLSNKTNILSMVSWVKWFNDKLLVIDYGARGADLVDLEGKVVVDTGLAYLGELEPDSKGNQRILYLTERGAIRYNMETGEKTLINRSEPSGKPIYWIYDRQGEARVVTTYDTAFWSDDTTITHWFRESPKHPWEKLGAFAYLDEQWDPLYFSKDGKSLVVSSSQGRDTNAYFRYDLKERKLGEMMAGHPSEDIYADFDTSEEDARYVLTRGMKTQIQWFESKWAGLQRSIDAALPNRINRLEGDPEKLVLISSYSDVDPGQWFLLDVGKKTFRSVTKRKPEIDIEQMRPKQIIHYKGRDGMTIPAYLTTPAGSSVGGPAVVLIHGGPHTRDGWNFDPEVQMLAARGYTVLQPQFRGSGGFGKRYVEAGWGQWGLSMQDDVSEGVRWLVENKHADPARICIYGASYGGYAALWGMAKTPELYRCGISMAGVSDLQYMLKDSSDVNGSAAGRLFRSRVFGSSAARKQVLDDVSPLKNAARFSAPVLIAHGELDQRVPIAHSKKMVKALKNNNKEVEWISMEEEGHGIYHEKNKELFYGAMFKLLDRTIGPGRPGAAVPATAAPGPAPAQAALP